jgi:hypothetical protein
MKTSRLFSTVSILLLCLTATAYQVQAQQPVPGSTSQNNSGPGVSASCTEMGGAEREQQSHHEAGERPPSRGATRLRVGSTLHWRATLMQRHSHWWH